MGMYDYVDYECTCPVCYNKVEGFQTKDGDCLLDTIAPKTIENFYSDCPCCGCWIEFTRCDSNGSFIRTVQGKSWDTIDKFTKEVKI